MSALSINLASLVNTTGFALTQGCCKEVLAGSKLSGRSVSALSATAIPPFNAMESTALVVYYNLADKLNFSSNTATDALPKATTPIEVSYTCDEVEASVSKSLNQLKLSTDYSGFHTISAFIGYYDAEKKVNPSITELEALKKFQPDSRKEVQTHSSGSCVGQSYAVVDNLAQHTLGGQPIKGFVMTEKGALEPFNHAAVCVPCKDGVVLVELAWDEPTRAVSYKEGLLDIKGPVKSNFQVVELPKDYKAHQPLLSKICHDDKSTECFEYLFASEDSPDMGVMKHWMLREDQYPMAGMDDQGITRSTIKCDLTRGVITFQDQQAANAKIKDPPPRVSIPFAKLDIDFASGTIRNPEVQEFLKSHPQYFSYFKTHQTTILQEIALMAANAQKLLNLHIENVLTELKECKDPKLWQKLVERLDRILPHSSVDDTLIKFAAALQPNPELITQIKKSVSNPDCRAKLDQLALKKI